MRILFDARSVRTPAGNQVFHGLTAGWVADPRVERVYAVVSGTDRPVRVPAGVEVVEVPRSGWLTYLRKVLPGVANRLVVDVIFSPNALAPRDPRSVAYFQDLHHFRSAAGGGDGLRRVALRLLRRSWQRYALRDAKLAVSVSADIAHFVAREVPAPGVLIRNGVEVNGAWWSGERDALFVMGGIGLRKGEALAVRAWAEVAREFPGTRLVVGGVAPDERVGALRRLAAELGVEGSVEVHGLLPREAYLEHIARSRLAVSCTTLESFGLPVAEALLMGAPVLCTDLPAHRELIGALRAGAAFRVGDAADLAARMRWALGGTAGPPRLQSRVSGWDWRTRAAEHITAYQAHGS